MGHTVGPRNPRCRTLLSKGPSSDHLPSLGHSAHGPDPRRGVGLPSLCHILSLGGDGGRAPGLTSTTDHVGWKEGRHPKKRPCDITKTKGREVNRQRQETSTPFQLSAAQHTVVHTVL